MSVAERVLVQLMAIMRCTRNCLVNPTKVSEAPVWASQDQGSGGGGPVRFRVRSNAWHIVGRVCAILAAQPRVRKERVGNTRYPEVSALNRPSRMLRQAGQEVELQRVAAEQSTKLIHERLTLVTEQALAEQGRSKQRANIE